MRNTIIDLVAFAILMENNDGILGKSPDYIEEKYKACMEGGYSLDINNQKKFEDWKERWVEDERINEQS